MGCDSTLEVNVNSQVCQRLLATVGAGQGTLPDSAILLDGFDNRLDQG